MQNKSCKNFYVEFTFQYNCKNFVLENIKKLKPKSTTTKKKLQVGTTLQQK